MTAAEVIEEIERLPREERRKVIDFARNSVKRKALTQDEMVLIGERMLAATDRAEADRLRRELVAGFYDEE